MKSSPHGRILVASRHVKERGSLESALSGTGAKFVFAKNGREAYDILHSMRVDVTVADLSLLKMDGPTLIEKLRQEELLVPFVFCFDEVDSEKVKRVVHHSFLDLLRRPYEPEQLLGYVEKALAMSKRVHGLNDLLHHLCREANFPTIRTRELLSLQKRSLVSLLSPAPARKKAA